MTDQTTNIMNSYSRPRTNATWEYRIYFTLIFMAALPFAFGGVILSLFGFGGTRRKGGVLKRAWAEAHSITPMIFRG